MKKNVLALSIATAVVGFAGSAHAIGTIGTNATATQLTFGDTGIGHMLLVPYFSTQNGNATLLSLVNTDTVNGKAVKVRFRGAKNSDDIFDFQVFLSPGDVWTANVSQNADGRSALTTEDNSCTRPKNVNAPFVLSRVSGNKGAETLEGYVEIFNMADVKPTSNVYNVIKHNKSGVAPCYAAEGADLAAWNKLSTDLADEAAYADLGLVNPTTGLMANWTIMNVPKALSWSGTATAIQAVVDTATNTLGSGNVVYFPQQDKPVGASTVANFTADPLLVGGQVAAAQYDLPDMSTPYLKGLPAGALAPNAQALSLANSIATMAVINEFWTEDTIMANTDWVFSMPTRRYAVAMDYKASTPNTARQNAGLTTHFDLTKNVVKNADALCVNDPSADTWGREEENEVASNDDVISPGTPSEKKSFCGEVSILSFGNGADVERSAVLGAAIARSDISAKYQNGWVQISTPGATNAGLPIIGSAFASAFNQAVDVGTSGNFSVNWNHRFVRPAGAK